MNGYLVKEGGADVVKMAEQGEDAATRLVVPQLQRRAIKFRGNIVGVVMAYLDLIIIAS
jgi:hypothetical protein